MKRLFVLALALALPLSLAACGGNSGGGNSTGNANNPPANTAGNNTASSAPANDSDGSNVTAKTPSITPADGWEQDTSGAALTYKCTDTSKSAFATFTMRSEGTPRSDKGLNTAKDYAEYAVNELKDAGYTFSDIAETTVNGMDAAEFTGATSGIKQRSVFVMAGVSVYSLVCTASDSSYDKVSDDFQSMIDSFTLK